MDIAAPADMARYLRSLERRVSDLEKANPLARASAHDGTTTRVEIGAVAHPYSNPANQDDFGIIVRDADGVPAFMVDSGGALIPGNPGYIADLNEENSHTSGSWIDSAFVVYFVGTTAQVISIQTQYRCGTGITAAEMRLKTNSINDPSDFTSEAFALTCDNTYINQTFHWSPGYTANPDDVWWLTLETRITGGAGTLDVRRPRWATLRSDVAVDTNLNNA